MKITVDDEPVRRDIEHLKKRIVPAAQEAAEAATKEFGERLKKRVQDMIPDKGGWYDIYKKSIQLTQLDDGSWELTTIISQIKPEQIPADLSLIWISAKDSADATAVNAARVLSQHNPWSLDSIPAVKKGLPADLLIKPASPGEVEHYRKLRLSERIQITHQILTVGAIVEGFDESLPEFNGKVMADVPFLALRLEYGYGGFSSTPIWSRIDQEGAIISQSRAVKEAGYGTFARRWREKK